MKTYLVSIPTKKTEEVNWTKPLNKYLLSVYGNTSDYQEDLTSFNKLRQDLRGAVANKTGIKLYCKYYSQIELLDLRIPFATVNRSKKIVFDWCDVFQQGVSHKQNALPYEKANVLFNLGSILSKYAVFKYEESQKGSSADSNPDTLIGESIKHLQQAAGVYQFIQENFLHAPSYDLSQSTIKFLVKLLLAQSQEIFVMKVISGDLEQKKNSLISKLCRSASSHYEECLKMTTNLENDIEALGATESRDSDEDEVPSSDIWESPEDEEGEALESGSKVDAEIDETWIAILQFKTVYYKSLAYYFNGLNFEASRKYGQALAYLQKSSDILNGIESQTLKTINKKASSAGSSDAYELLENYKGQKDAVAIKLADLNKDNDLIYHDIIPSLVTLPDIKAMDSTKIISMNEIDQFQEINDYNYNHFLKNVIPINIHELLSFYSEEKSQFLRNEIDLVDVSNEELASVLEYLKMPKSLVTLKELMRSKDDYSLAATNGADIDPKLISIANEVASKYNNDNSNRDKIVQSRKQIFDQISESEAALARAGSGSDPEKLRKFKDDLIKVKKALYDATNSDNRLFGLVNESNGPLYNALGKGPKSAEFGRLFEVGGESAKPKNLVEEISLLDIDDSVPANTNGEIQQRIKKVEDILQDLNTIKSNKLKLVEALKKEIHGDDIADILILNSRVKSTSEIKEVIFPEEMRKFEVYNVELDKLIEKQKVLLRELNSEWEILTKNPEVKQIQHSKTFTDQVVRDQHHKIVEFYEGPWQQYAVGLGRGVEFYQQLIGYSTGLQHKIHEEAGKQITRPSMQVPHNYGSGSQSHLNYSSGAYGVAQEYGANEGPVAPSLPPKRQTGPNEIQGNTAKVSGDASDLIYDNPSTYQPNMYNFFSNS